MNKRCLESGQVYLNKPWWSRPEEPFRIGNRVTCSCGKKVKLRKPLSCGIVYTMVPHHNVPKYSA